MEEVKGCIWCYHGSKIRYLDNILKVISNKERSYKVIDLFTGGSSVASSLPVHWEITANDIEDRVVGFSIELQRLLSIYPPEKVEWLVKSFCHSVVASNSDEEGYLKLKYSYNKGDREAFNLFALTMSSNSNMIRFNSKGEQTLQFGKRWYNSNSSKKLLSYLRRVNQRSIDFTSKDFKSIVDSSPVYDIWIIDPPYRTSKATYSESGQWGLRDETKLLAHCDKLQREGKKFIYFNQTFTQGVENKIVNLWKDKYKSVVLKDTTTNCSAQRKNTGTTTELMIHNF